MIQPPPIAPIVLPSTFSSVDYAVRFDAEPQVIMDTTKLNNDKHYEIISDLRVNTSAYFCLSLLFKFFYCSFK